jgi:hypothetical protein
VFAKVRTATVRFVSQSVSPSARPHATNGLPPNNFCGVLYFNASRKSIEKIRDSLKSDNDGHFTGRSVTSKLSCSILLRRRNVSDKS